MDRRDVLRIGTAAGTLFIGERLELAQAATTAVKPPITSVYSGAMIVPHREDSEFRLTFGVAHGKVSGTVYVDGAPHYTVRGTLRKGRLIARAFNRLDPDDNYFTFNGKLKGATIKGTLKRDLSVGTFSASKWKTDVQEMRSLAGQYEGIVSRGFAWIGKCQVKANGTFRLYDIEAPDGQPLQKPILGFYVLQKPTRQGSAARDVEGTLGILAFMFYACAQPVCKTINDGCDDRPPDALAELDRQNRKTRELNELNADPPHPGPIRVSAGRVR